MINLFRKLILWCAYKRYKRLDTPRTFEKMEIFGVLEDYKYFMSDCEYYLLGKDNIKTLSDTISIPKPSKKLEDFKNKFGKFF